MLRNIYYLFIAVVSNCNIYSKLESNYIELEIGKNDWKNFLNIKMRVM